MEPILRNTNHLYWMFIPMLACLLSVVVVKVFRERNFVSIFEGFTDIRAFRRYIREESTYKGLVSNVLMLNSLLVFSLFTIYIASKLFSFSLSVSLFELWGYLIAALFFYYWFKRIIASIIGYFSGESVVLTEYVIYNKFYIKFIGIILLPLLFFLNFLNYDLTNPMFHFIQVWLPRIMILFIVLSYLTKIYNGYQQCLEIKVSGYYLILYFCTLEILPLVGIYFWLVGNF